MYTNFTFSFFFEVIIFSPSIREISIKKFYCNSNYEEQCIDKMHVVAQRNEAHCLLLLSGLFTSLSLRIINPEIVGLNILGTIPIIIYPAAWHRNKQSQLHPFEQNNGLYIYRHAGEHLPLSLSLSFRSIT